ncbi:IscS subfamily cysteine desulfurase [Enterobacteriaceae bacterium ET-AT1-13]|nr:IscS subfamily cysteine desulfurase [Enterobacteriaceae bacterium ET-AT1-13]WGS66526.1 IscS subfamily cysteine desulfurase [Enterobacteriaceae bacterium Cmel17]WMC17551.1 MAG: IscS subfamily cysteine desulfurase [Enterobacteriaceae bacterium Cmel21]WMC17755.1 MAG: IscS subfamily cysteine desulfurase [Enterobacteriaceae bacterium PSmelAO3-2]WMC17959.1 MAG: IscS subfamily cysteine desulfurase [Enterobacteriaceae bacterium PSmelAO3-1]WMC18161.1 MAG: IscS subfamily cysteine desulfurase [Enterob
MMLPIYMDYSATSPVDKRVVFKMMKYLMLNGNFGNPSSRSHYFGWRAEESVNYYRKKIAKLINVNFKEIIFTSGATESINLAIKGVASFYKKRGKHIITCKTEHKSVLDSCRYLEKKGFNISYIKPEINGIINIKTILDNINCETILISIMHVNNEIGIIQNIKKISKLCFKKKIFFHVDATQSIGKTFINFQKIKTNLVSFSAHKIYGPKGIGVLYINNTSKIRIEPQIHGGGHEKGIRSGTLAVHQIVGIGESCNILLKEMNNDIYFFHLLKCRFWNGIKNIEEVYLNGEFNYSVPNIINISFNYIEGESLIMSLKNLAVSSGSACTSSSLEPSYVLISLGINEQLAHSSIRFSFGRFSKIEEIDYSIYLIIKSIKKLRDISPLWEIFKQGIDINSIIWKDN